MRTELLIPGLGCPGAQQKKECPSVNTNSTDPSTELEWDDGECVI